jgi:hypothetical protein
MTERILGGLVAAMVTLATAACSGGGSTASTSTAASVDSTSWPRCFEIIESGSRTVMKVEAAPTATDPDGAQVTVYSYVDGVEEFAPETTEPETTLGRLDGSAFVYADGTRLVLTESSLTWPAESILAGAVLAATSCP